MHAAIKWQITCPVYGHKCWMPNEREGVHDTKCSVASMTYHLKAFPCPSFCLSWQAPLSAVPFLVFDKPFCGQDQPNDTLFFSYRRLLFNQLQFTVWVCYSAHKHCAGTMTPSALWRRSHWWRASKTCFRWCCHTEKLCAPTLWKGLLFVLLHITSIHSENTLTWC